MIRPLLDAVQRHVARRAIIRRGLRQDEWEYPETAVREALVNALVHRDLSAGARGTPVQVQLFPDRLTVINPGGLFGPISVDRLGELGISSARNQVLMKMPEDSETPDEGRLVCENRGSGIGAMLAALRQSGLPNPRFDDRVATFSITFESPQAVAEPTAPVHRRRDSSQDVLDLLGETAELSRVEIADALELSVDHTRRLLAELRNRGAIELTTTSPNSPHARYRKARWVRLTRRL